MTMYLKTADQVKFVNDLTKKFGKDATLAPKEILTFAESLGIPRPNWFFAKVGKRVSQSRWEWNSDVAVAAPKVKTVKPAKTAGANKRAKKTSAPVPVFTDNVVVDDRDREVAAS